MDEEGSRSIPEQEYVHDHDKFDKACIARTTHGLEPVQSDDPGLDCVACVEDGIEVPFADLLIHAPKGKGKARPRSPDTAGPDTAGPTPRTSPSASEEQRQKEAIAAKNAIIHANKRPDEGPANQGDSFEAKKDRFEKMLKNLVNNLEALYSRFDDELQTRIYNLAIDRQIHGITRQLRGRDDDHVLTEEILDEYIRDFEIDFTRALTHNVNYVIANIDKIDKLEEAADDEAEGSTGGRKSKRFKKRRAKRSTRRKRFWFF